MPQLFRSHVPLPCSGHNCVIDDLPEGRSMLAELLSLEGYEIYEAETGLSGLRLAVEHSVDVALIDIGLPDISGHEVAKRLREMQGIEPVCLIALTGHGQASDVVNMQVAGFNHHLTKPVDVDSLLEPLEIC